MGLPELIERMLLNMNGQVSLDDINEYLGKQYSRQTILDFLQNEKELISFDGKTIILVKYPIQYFIQVLEDYIKNAGASRKDVFYSGAYYLFMKRIIPSITPEIILDGLNKKDWEKDQILFEIGQITKKLGTSFSNALRNFFNSGWIKKLDTKEFYSFTQEFYEYFLNSTIGEQGLYTTPSTLVELICQIIPNDPNLHIYSPAAGALKLLTAIKNHSKYNILATASEGNEEIYKIAHLFARTNNFEVALYNKDILDINYYYGAFDLIVSIQPFIAYINPNDQSNQFYKDPTLNLISHSLFLLKGNGMAIFLVTENVLYSQSPEFLKFRQEILGRKLIHTIISLPVQLFHPTTSVKTSLLIFKTGINHSVRFIDASSKDFFSTIKNKSITLKIDKIKELMEEVNKPKPISNDQELAEIPRTLEIDYDQIKKEKFSLNLNDYFIQFISPKGSQYVELGEITSVVKLHPGFEPGLPYLGIKNLNGRIIDNINYLSTNQNRNKGKILKEQAILINTVGGNFKPSWYQSAMPVEISTNIVAIKVDSDKVDNEYLLQELNSVYVQEQMNFLSIGATTLTHLRIEDLLKIKIKLPSLQEQVQIIKSRKEFVQQQSLTPISSSGTITDADIFKTINHEIGNILKGPDGFLNLLPHFLERQMIQLNLPFSGHKQSRTIGERIQSAKEDISKVYKIMANMEGILMAESSVFRPEKTDLGLYILRKFELLKDHHSFELIIGTNGDYFNPSHVQAEIDKMQFERIITNICSNALNHGNILDERLIIVVNLVLIENKIEIHFMNNGESFPTDFKVEDYIGFSRKSGGSSGQGIGGFLIYKITKNHSGQIDIMPPSSFQIKTKDGKLNYNANVDIVITIPQKQ